MTEAEGVRVDKWLWAARFFKTRSMAAQAVSGGHVHVNGQRVKPARNIQAGDILRITKGPYTFEVVVENLSQRRGPAVEARTLYAETEDSLSEREKVREQRRLTNASAVAPERRPDKRDRRKIRKLQRKIS